MPGVPMVAVFDTAFHQTMPPKAYLYGLPYSYYEKYKIRRYGFHGTSHSFVSKRTAEFTGLDINNSKIIVCHLGNGASVTAVLNGKSIDTSMGLTPLEGLTMGTRSGDLDPAIIEFIAHKENKTIDEVMELLNKKSGVFGLTNELSSDFRDLTDAALSGNVLAQQAFEVFTYRVAKYIGSYVAAMSGVDAIAFTAGIGENDDLVRKMVVDYLGYLGVTLDEENNNTRGKEVYISKPDSKVKVCIIPTNEELAIARETKALLHQ
jgi:acetate kinase